jgi:outer membrane receptor protein involved in Fe transport
MFAHTLKILVALFLLTTSVLAVSLRVLAQDEEVTELPNAGTQSPPTAIYTQDKSRIESDYGSAECMHKSPEYLEWQCLPIISTEMIPPQKGQSVTHLRGADQHTMRLDSYLSAVPGLGLFRRANSLTAHPTTQGLTMRGVGANAAGRVLVTLDGVPLNDPFGGWIYWSALDLERIDHAAILKGGSAGAYGAQALAGSVALVTEIPAPVYRENDTSDNGYHLDESTAFLKTSYGAFDTREVRAGYLFAPQDGGSFSVTGGHFETDGAYLLDEDQRGAVDVQAASETQYFSLGASFDVSDTTRIFPNLRWFQEKRTNGLSLAVNETEAFDASLRIVHNAFDGPSWEVNTYYRIRDFSNLFVSARDERSSERPVLDQFDVPAWGAGFLARLHIGGFEAGIDGRRMSGETNERFRNLGAGFTRQRRAGGDQWVLGVYGEYTGRINKTAVSATMRLDRWRTYNGARLETDLADNAVVRQDTVPNRANWIWSGRVGVEHEVSAAVSVRTAAYKSWRLPTLNEYYRPFRVVNDITEANPNLVPEKLYGVEFGVDYQPLPTMKMSATLFRSWLRDGVGNVTIGFGPGFFELGGFVPEGGVLRQRANIDRSVTDGIEMDGHIQLHNGWDLTVRYLYARARVTKFDARPELVDKQPVQTPRHSGTVALSYDDRDDYSFTVEGRIASTQYDDDLNERELGAIFTVNAGAVYVLRQGVSVTANVENLFDAKVVSAVTAEGLETIAQRRFARLGLELSF